MAGGHAGRMIVGVGGIGPLEVKGVGLERDERRAERHDNGRAASQPRRHALSSQLPPTRWSDGFLRARAPRGGDILVSGCGAVMVGMGERTRPAAVEALAERLFAAGGATPPRCTYAA